MLIKPDKSALLVIDVQERLLPAVHQSETVEQAVCDLINVAEQLDVPILYSEQYPKGLGPTCDKVAEALPDAAVRLEKLTFSCAADPKFSDKINAIQRPQIVICGMETHVCVLQTALDLTAQGCGVFVVADAVSSRAEQNKELGVARMRQAGVEIVTKEMVIFEWLERAGTESFRSISKAYLR